MIIGVLGIVTKGLVQGLEDLERSGGVETFQTTKLLRLARIPRRVLLPRELKKLWSMKVTIIPIVIGAFGTVIKGF